LVVLFHLGLIERKYGVVDTLLPGVLQFGASGVDLFFVISGFVMVTVTRGHFRNARQALVFLFRRVTRIYPLYWVYSLLALAVFLIQPSWVNSTQGNQVNLLASFLLLPSDRLPLVQVGWSLIHEMYFYLAYFSILLLLPERALAFSLAAWGAGVVLLHLTVSPSNPALALVSHPLTWEFLGGCLVAVMFHRRDTGPRGGTAFMIIAGVLFVASVAGHEVNRYITGQVVPEGWWRVLIYGGPAVGIVYALTAAERKGVVLPSVLVHVGNASYSIYLSHLFVLSVAGRIWQRVLTTGSADNVLFALMAFGLVLLTGVASYWLVETPLLQLTRDPRHRKDVVTSDGAAAQRPERMM
jgi:peptidoglycan/LPS O-acetylase OafA/YrhL